MQKIFVVAVQDQLFPFIPAAKLFVGSVIARSAVSASCIDKGIKKQSKTGKTQAVNVGYGIGPRLLCFYKKLLLVALK